MSWDNLCDSLCPMARSLAVVGDRWTLLILRELSLGAHRFDEMQAQTGMSSHLLATRLKRLEKDGVLEKRRYSERPVRYEYHVTAKGRDLDPLLQLLQNWGLKWGGYATDANGQPVAPARRSSSRAGATRRGAASAKTAGRVPHLPLADAMRAEREAKHAAFLAGKSAARSSRVA